MATDQIDSIAPGSVPFGERQALEGELASQPAPGPTGLGPVSPPGVPPQGEMDIDPEGMLAQGPVSDLPITAGLSVGPGPGPLQGIESTSEQERLRELALNAPSALLRYSAGLALRRIYEKQKRGL